MKINYLKNGANVSTEVRDNVINAIKWERCNMLLTLNQEGQEKQSAIIQSEKSTKL